MEAAARHAHEPRRKSRARAHAAYLRQVMHRRRDGREVNAMLVPKDGAVKREVRCHEHEQHGHDQQAHPL